MGLLETARGLLGRDDVESSVCNHCGTKNGPEYTFCRHCARDIDGQAASEPDDDHVYRCARCSRTLERDHRECPQCGGLVVQVE